LFGALVSLAFFASVCAVLFASLLILMTEIALPLQLPETNGRAGSEAILL
jgi:hypothetical protein